MTATGQASPPGDASRFWLLELFESLVVIVVYSFLLWRLLSGPWQESSDRFAVTLLLCSEGAVVFFFLIRRRSQCVSTNPGEWALAFLATLLPQFVERQSYWTPESHDLLIRVSYCLLMSGLSIQLLAKLALCRSMGCVPANRGVVEFGPYRVVRHPMYAGYLLTHIGFLMSFPTAWNAGLYLLCWGLQIPRLLAEERLLQSDPVYRGYTRRVNWRLIPFIY